MLRPRALFEENFFGWHILSGHTEREFQLRMFASYSSLELALLFSIYTNKQFKVLKSLDTVQLVDFWFRCFSSRERNRRQNCCGQGEKFAENE